MTSDIESKKLDYFSFSNNENANSEPPDCNELRMVAEAKEDYEEIVTGNEVTIELSTEAPIITHSPSSSNSSNRSNGGICSALLEVIEKLRQTEETDHRTIEKKRNTTSGSKTRKSKAIEGEASRETELKTIETTKSKRGRKRKVNELISEKELLELNAKVKEKPAANTIVNIINNNEAIKAKILNNNKKQQLNYLCINCKKQFLNKINLELHRNNECLETVDSNGLDYKSLDIIQNATEFEIIYACHTCDFKCLIKENLIDHLTKIHNEKVISSTGDMRSENFGITNDDGLKLEIKGEAIKPIDSKKTIKINNSIKRRFISSVTLTSTQTESNSSHSTDITMPATLSNNLNNSNNKFVSLLISLATNDGHEQYVCGLCPYVCYHLPSLKSHMWTHVTNREFDYSLNTSIINAALDYENKLNRQLLSYNGTINGSNTPFNDLANPYELINYPLSNKIPQQAQNSTASTANGIPNSSSCDKPMVSFRCSKCGYSTINLSLLRLHKRQHYIKIISPNTAKMQLNKINEKETQKVVINS